MSGTSYGKEGGSEDGRGGGDNKGRRQRGGGLQRGWRGRGGVRRGSVRAARVMWEVGLWRAEERVS